MNKTNLSQISKFSQQTPSLKNYKDARIQSKPKISTYKSFLGLSPILRFFLKWANPGLLFVYFRAFHIRTQLTNVQFEQFKLKTA